MGNNALRNHCKTAMRTRNKDRAAACVVASPTKAHPTGEAVTSIPIETLADAVASKIVQQPRDAVTFEKVILPWDNKKFAMKIRGVVSKQLCSDLIELADCGGFEPALVSGWGGQEYIPSYRHSERCMIDHPRIADAIFQHIQTQLPMKYGHLVPTELNERLRFLRYNENDFFAPHKDGSYARPRGHRRDGDVSRVTLLLYLNEDYAGQTRVFSDSSADHLDITPEAGMIFVHDHDILHEGSPITSGIKYCIRTDVMYGERDQINHQTL